MAPSKLSICRYIAWALIYLKMQKAREQLGEAVLYDLVQLNPSRPEAYIILWDHVFKRLKDYDRALTIAEQLFICATDYASF